MRPIHAFLLEDESPDTGVPATRAARAPVVGVVCIVFVCIPKCAPIRRIDRHHAVVAPPLPGWNLRRGACDKLRLTLGQQSGRIGTEPAGVPDRRAHTVTRNAVTQGHVLPLIHGYASHPAVLEELLRILRRVGPLLKYERRASGILNLVPSDAGNAAKAVHLNGMVHNQSLMVVESAILQPMHQPIGQCLKLLWRPHLRDAGKEWKSQAKCTIEIRNRHGNRT